MSANQMERPKYFEEQYLGAADLTAAVDYARIQQARHALGAHTWGIAAGLQLREIPLPTGRVDVYLLPGYAWDGYGRPIVVLSPYRIPEEKFAQFQFQAGTDPEGHGQLIPIWLRYEEKESVFSNSVSVLCDLSNRASRIQETFALEVGSKNENELTSGVNLAGRLVTNPKTFLREFDPASALVHDESIPHQNFSDLPTKARWLIPIGFVRWLPVQGQLGHFVARDDSGTDPDSAKIRRARRYIGVVTEQIVAADGAIRLRNRTDNPADSSFKPPSLIESESDLVSVEGNMRVEGDNRICGGSVDFRDSAGRNFDVPMRIERNDATPGHRALRVLIGPKTEPSNSFSISVEDGDSFQDRFVILSGGNVGIGTSAPTDHLQVVGDVRISGLARKPDGGGWTYASDLRLKRNIEPVSNALDRLLQLRGVSFEWKEPDKMGSPSGSQFGLVAQEVEKVIPEWVTRDQEGYRELTMRGFEALVIEALRELKSEIEDLRSQPPTRSTAKQRPAQKGKKQAATKA